MTADLSGVVSGVGRKLGGLLASKDVDLSSSCSRDSGRNVHLVSGVR